MTEAGKAFEEKSGTAVEGTFGASGLLRERIEKGEPAEVFASANMEHPQALERAVRAGPVRLFARNRLCALSRDEFPPDRLLDRLLDPAIKVGTSTPKARQENPALRIVAIPEALAVGADYGMALMRGAGADAQRFAEFVLSERGQAILLKYGFARGENQ